MKKKKRCLAVSLKALIASLQEIIALRRVVCLKILSSPESRTADPFCLSHKYPELPLTHFIDIFSFPALFATQDEWYTQLMAKE